MISPELQSEFDEAHKKENTYRPSLAVQKTLLNKEFIMLVGPVAIGKSTLMNRVIELDQNFARVKNMVSRPMRSNDEPGRYTYIPHTNAGVRQILDMISKGELVQYAVHATTGFIYATKPEGYPAKYNMLDTQAKVIDSLSELPFHKTHIIQLVTDPKSWQRWFLNREKKGTDEYNKRLDEAILSLELMTSRPEESVHWIYNHPDDLTTSAKELIAVVKGTKKSDLKNRQYALEMLSLAQQMKG